MDIIRQKNIHSVVFVLVFLTIPIIATPLNSELFEFNKIVILYTLTTIAVGAWIARMIWEKRIIIKRTPFDIPLLLFLASQILSTIFSIDLHTSIFGYYSRFNGGLLSTICYLLLYWAFVSNIDARQAKAILKTTLWTAAFVAIWGILEHFGHSPSCLIITGKFNAECWVQDVQNRVFATLGQPNWLAAYLVVLIFIPVSETIANIKNQRSKIQIKNLNITILANLAISLLLFACLLFTKSRSGILAFAISSLAYWTLLIIKTRDAKFLVKPFLVFNISFLILVATFGTPWTPSLESYLKSRSQSPITSKPQPADLLISESGDIRKVVWKGAINLWKLKPVFGSGVETFAYAYYWTRPPEHNLLSEWDFVYNKAHNQYLNLAATSGSIGLLTYILVIGTAVLIFLKPQATSSNDLGFLPAALAAGWFSILITNFFGFSVVPVDLLFFLLPAIATVIQAQSPDPNYQTQFSRLQQGFDGEPNLKSQISIPQVTGLAFISISTLYLLISIGRYWFSDFHYAKSVTFSKTVLTLPDAFDEIRNAIRLNHSEPIMLDRLSSISTDIAGATKNNASISAQMKDLAVAASDEAIRLSPYNLTLLQNRAANLNSLTSLDPSLFPQSVAALQAAINISPSFPKFYYNLGVIYSQKGIFDPAIENLKKAYQLKPNYQEPLLALAQIYDKEKDQKTALEYYRKLLEINPSNPIAKQKLGLPAN